MRDSKAARRNTAALALVLVLATAYYLFVQQGAPTFRYSPQERAFVLGGAKQTQAAFSLDGLTSLELYEGGDYGTALEGNRLALSGVRYGVWESESLGTYEAFYSEKTAVTIVARDAEKTAVFNIADEDTTRALYAELAALWHDVR